MAKPPIGQCPLPKEFLRWYRRQLGTNLGHIRQNGGSVRTGMIATEGQANRKFRLVKKGWEGGEVIEKLLECGVGVKDRGDGVHSQQGLAHLNDVRGEDKHGRPILINGPKQRQFDASFDYGSSGSVSGLPAKSAPRKLAPGVRPTRADWES